MHADRPTVSPFVRLFFRPSALLAFALAWGPAALAATAPGASPAAETPRGALTREVVPERYALTLTIDPRQPRFTGAAEIAVRLANPTTRIFLHGDGLAVTRAELRAAGRTYPLQYRELDATLGVARLDAAETLPAGAATLALEWSAPFLAGGQGLYKVTAGGESYAFTQMEPISARKVFPGFDDPQFKTPFEITVITPAANRVVANAPEAGTEPAPDGAVRHRFRPTLPLPTYLIALAVGPLDVVEGTPIAAKGVQRPPVPLRGVATKGQGPRLKYALEHTPEILQALEDYFGIAFPYPKLDIIASPDMGGAMENAGAIIYADGLILLDPNAPPSQLRGFYEVSAHEIAHHWFGDLVTPKWWDDIWLNESFAEWMGVKIANGLRPDLVPATSLTQEALSAMPSDARAAGRPIRQPVPENAGIAGTFDSITYQKGGGVLSMIESYVGPEAFRRGVRLHLQRHPYGTATADEFFAAMAEAAKQPQVVDAFRSFVTQAGFPLLAAKRLPNGDVELRQSRYVPVGSTVAQGQQWRIPVCATFYGATKSAKNCTLMTGPTATIAAPKDVGPVAAVLPNADGAGYFRFALDERDLRDLLGRAPTLPDREALVLADSVIGAFHAGLAPLATMFDAAQALSTHRNRQVATQVGFELLDVGDRALEPGQNAALQRRIARIYGPPLADVGVALDAPTNARDPADVQLRRAALVSLVGLYGRDPALRSQLAAAAQAGLQKPDALANGLRNRAWAAAVEDGVAPVIAAANAALTGPDPLARGHAAYALSFSRGADAAKARQRVLEPAVPLNEALGVLFGQLERPETRADSWTWLQQNWTALNARVPDIVRPYLLQAGTSFCSEDRRREVAAFGEKAIAEMHQGRLELDRALESIQLCTALKARHAPEFAELERLSRSDPPRAAAR